MKEALHKFKEWWAALGVREKKFVSIGCGVLLIFVLYQFVWLGLTNRVVFLRERIIKEQHMLTAMQAMDKEIQQLSPSVRVASTPASVVTVLGAVQKQINQAGLASALTGLKQGSHDAIEMHFQKVDFDKLMRTLVSVCEQNRVTITQLSATAQKESGTVNADIILAVRTG